MNWEQPDLEALRAEAEAGDAEAQTQLGDIYYDGEQVEKNHEEALRWWSMAAKQDDADSQYQAALFLEYYHNDSREDMLQAFNWFTQAAKQGLASAQYKLGNIFEKGLTYNRWFEDQDKYIDLVILSVDYNNAAHWYRQAVNQGHSEANYRLGLLTRDGLGVIKNNKKSFHFMLTAACGGIVISAMAELSRFYHQGFGVKKNPIESYIWALLAKARNHSLIDADYLCALECGLSEEQIFAAQDEAETRAKMLETHRLTPEYCLGKAAKYKPGLAPGDRIHIIGRAVIPEEPAAKAKETPADDDPEPSSDLVFRYLKVCNKHFDPSLVQFELIIPHKLTRKETLDFTQIKIRYNGRNTDLKNVTTFAAKHIYKAERRLLLRLAAQYSVSDAEKRNQNIYRILQEPRMRPAASRWNSLFEDIFPQCSKHRYNKMINRETGHIAIALTVDTTKITNASDYDTCYLKF